MAYSGTTVNVVSWLFASIAILVVGLRLFTRLRVAKSPGSDDVIIVWSLLLNVVSTALVSWSITAGTGQHLTTLSLPEAVHAFKTELITSSVSCQCFAWPKLSVALLLIRLLNPPRRTRILFYCLTGFLILCSCILTIFWYVQCSPTSAYWDPRVKGSCWPRAVITDMGYFTGSYCAFLDLYFALYPIPVLWALQMAKTRKLLLCGVLSLGILACGVTIYKTYILHTITSDSDVTYIFAEILLWNCLEVNLIILAACLPTLGPLLRETRNLSSKTFSHTPGMRWLRSSGSPGSSSDQNRSFFKHKSNNYTQFPHSNDTESSYKLVEGHMGRGTADAGDDLWLADVDKQGRSSARVQQGRVQALPPPGRTDHDLERDASGSAPGIAMRTDVDVFTEDRRDGLSH